MRYKLPKSNHLCSEIAISSLYRTGKAFLVFPLRVVFNIESRTAERETAVRVLFSAPKRRFRHAVDRNRYRRLMREAYRLRQHSLVSILEQHNLAIDFSLTAVNDTLPDYKYLCHSMDKVIDHLIAEVGEWVKKNVDADEDSYSISAQISAEEDENRTN